jgi:cytoskeletal protein RodZ
MSLGQHLQDARLAAGVSVDQLASLLSIRPGLLRDMENNNFATCGGDTYARGHLRSIAPRIGVNADELIEMYNSEHSAERRGIHDMLVENNVAKQQVEKKNISLKTLAVISISFLAVAGVAQIIISNSNTTTISAKPTPTAATKSATPSVAASATPSSSGVEVVPSSGKVSLTISASRGNSNVDVVVEGKHIYKGPMFQGDVKSFEGASSVSVYLSNAGDLDLTLNGKKLAPLGARNQEVRKTFRLGE